ncbi:phosphatidate cytidylyltransferase [Nocardia sp. CA-129566]|uniref:phosphatidate cytidylyltransferase n=1 Tax=Nocardia sp. CA-129566 TaxID=3239976 RepID=UPI003D958F25
MATDNPLDNPIFFDVLWRLSALFAILYVGVAVREWRRRADRRKESLVPGAVSATLLTCVVVAAAFAGGVAWWIVVTLLGVQLTVEYASLTSLDAGYKWLVVIWSIVGPSVSAIAFPDSMWTPAIQLVVVYLIATALPIVTGRNNDATAALGRVTLCGLYIILPLEYLLLVRSQGDHGLRILFLVLISVGLSDAFGYIAGTKAGGPKLAVNTSPEKTWSGVIGSVAGAAIGGVLFHSPLSISAMVSATVAYAILIAVLAVWGDLVESVLKRSAGVKNVGNTLPGFGGFLDRFDSLLIPAWFAVLLVEVG